MKIKNDYIKIILMIQFSEIISQSEMKFNYARYIEQIAKLDARKKDFKIKAQRILINFTKAFKRNKEKSNFLSGGVVHSNILEEFVVNDNTELRQNNIKNLKGFTNEPIDYKKLTDALKNC